MAEVILKEDITSALDRKRLFKCKVCEKSFSQKGNMSTHMSSVHDEKTAFECKVCEKMFSQKSNMTKHMSLVMN